MAWNFSRALVEECWRTNSTLLKQFVPSKSMNMLDLFLSHDKTTERSSRSQFGMTYERLTDARGEALLTWYREVFRANRSAPPRTVVVSPSIYGRRCFESSMKCDQKSCSLKTSQKNQSNEQRATCAKWVTIPSRRYFLRRTWVETTYGVDFGYLHTPTTKANFCAPYMQRWKSCRNYKTVFGEIRPTDLEYLMGWPIGHTALKPLEMGRFHWWRLLHFESS